MADAAIWSETYLASFALWASMDAHMWAPTANDKNTWFALIRAATLAATSGVDFLAAYWLGRRHGFIEDDTPDACLQWHDL